MEFKLPYWIRNNGDGSASVVPTPTLADAAIADEAETEGFAESTSGLIGLKVEDGKLFYYQMAKVAGKYKAQWTQVTEP